MFIGIAIPSRIQEQLTDGLNHYAELCGEQTLPENRHVTLLWLGPDPQPHDALPALTLPLAHSFTLTVAITHVGRGKNASQLWAYAAPTPALEIVRKLLIERVKENGLALPEDTHSDFTPHINLADLKSDSTQNILADYPVTAAFSVRELSVFERPAGSATYASLGTILLA